MLTYDELLSEYNKLKAENAELKAEIAKIKGTDVISIQSYTENVTSATVNKFSSPQNKISLFRSLFRGREDVFAKRWFSKTTEKTGYQPVCGNEWDDMLCDNRKHYITRINRYNCKTQKQFSSEIYGY